MAQTLLSTSPCPSPQRRMAPSSRSVASPDAFFGQATQSPPESRSERRSRGKERESSAAVRVNSTITSASPRARGTTPRVAANPRGPPAMRTRAPSLIPSFWGSGVPE